LLLLALDTSSPTFAGCLLDDGHVRVEWAYRVKLAGDLPRIGIIDEHLRRAGVTIGDVEALACTIGPGSFTGLRVGLSLAKGLSGFGELPLFGVSTLHALARSAAGGSDTLVVPCLDARRAEVYAAAYRGDELVLPEAAYDPAAFSAMVAEKAPGESIWFGDGARVYRELLEGDRRRFAPPYFDSPRGAAVASVAWERWLRGERPSAVQLTPHYLRASEAERVLQAKQPK
jgi:tRNA threonylcarbamoyladenosine biosynthesis protein TsaB